MKRTVTILIQEESDSQGTFTHGKATVDVSDVAFKDIYGYLQARKVLQRALNAYGRGRRDQKRLHGIEVLP